MAQTVTYNFKVDRQKKLPFRLSFRDKDTGESIDVSTWEFKFTLTNNIQVDVWTILNADFSRPDDYTIYFEKSVSDVNAVPAGNYIISLLATNTEMTDNEIMNGTWQFSN